MLHRNLFACYLALLCWGMLVLARDGTHHTHRHHEALEGPTYTYMEKPGDLKPVSDIQDVPTDQPDSSNAVLLERLSTLEQSLGSGSLVSKSSMAQLAISLCSIAAVCYLGTNVAALYDQAVSKFNQTIHYANETFHYVNETVRKSIDYVEETATVTVNATSGLGNNLNWLSSRVSSLFHKTNPEVKNATTEPLAEPVVTATNSPAPVTKVEQATISVVVNTTDIKSPPSEPEQVVVQSSSQNLTVVAQSEQRSEDKPAAKDLQVPRIEPIKVDGAKLQEKILSGRRASRPSRIWPW
jgi:hypothetical protein